MTFVPWAVTFHPLLGAVDDWAEIIKQGGLGAVILFLAYLLKLLVSGVFRLQREVEDRDKQIGELRHERDEAESKLEKLTASMMNDYLPAALRLSDTGERMETAVTKLTERAEQLIDAFLRRQTER